MTVIFNCPSIHRWALMGYFTHLHLSVQKWNKKFNGDAAVRVNNTDYNVSVELNNLDAYKFLFTWNSEFPHLTNYTSVEPH